MFSRKEQNALIYQVPKYRNFGFESLLTQYLVMTKPGRGYSFFILDQVMKLYDSELLKNVSGISLSVSGNENGQGYFFYKRNQDALVVNGNGLKWGELPHRGPQRATTSDLAFLITYTDSNKKKVVLGEVEGNKGRELLDKRYWDDKKPSCAIFGVGVDTIDDISYAHKEIIACKNRQVPVVIFPDTKSKIIKIDEQRTRDNSGLMDFIGTTYHRVFTEFIRFLACVEPGKEYHSIDSALGYIFSEISKKLWDVPLPKVLEHLESHYIQSEETQENFIESPERKRVIHYLSLEPKAHKHFVLKYKEDTLDPFRQMVASEKMEKN